MIPIRNLYYIFCYAWARFPEGNQIDVGEDTCPDLPNLFAKLLIEGLHQLIRQGLGRGYVEITEELRSPRGRLLFDAMVKQQTQLRGTAISRFNEFEHNVLHNQILKATVRLLIAAANLLPEHQHELRRLIRQLEAVQDIRLTAALFRRVQLSRHNRQYAMLLQLCEFVFHCTLPEQNGTGSRFADILQDEVRMSAVFEDFLRNFYAHEQQDFTVGRTVLAWQAIALSPGSADFLPRMETDITLKSKNRKIIIDAKYYKETLSRRRNSEKVRSDHLYQLFAYLHNATPGHGNERIDGILIYPTIGKHLCLDYQLPRHGLRVATIDLDQPWALIRQDLLSFLSTPLPGSNSEVRDVATSRLSLIPA